MAEATGIERSELLSVTREVAEHHVRPAAAAVDHDGRFPDESFEAVRSCGLLGAGIPGDLGGGGATMADLADICRALGSSCGSTGLIYAMHCNQVACLVRHGRGVDHLEELMVAIATAGRLVASATSEAGVGGDIRSSVCAVERDGDQFRLAKQATVVSYGEYADDILVTARKDSRAAAHDQVLVHVTAPGLRLERIGSWDALGMRGTASVGYAIDATGHVDQILPVPFDVIASSTMLPASHLLWSSVWLGITEDALARTHELVRAGARKQPGQPTAGAIRLADVHRRIDDMRARLHLALTEYEQVAGDPVASTALRWAMSLNDLKVAMSSSAVEVVGQLLGIAGLAAYRNDSPYSLGRALRDVLSAPLMVHNDRLDHHTATLLSAIKRL